MSNEVLLGLKRRKISENNDTEEIKNESSAEKIITLVKNSNFQKKVQLSFFYSLKKELENLEFQIPYYIPDNKQVIVKILDNRLIHYFYTKKSITIYNYEYKTCFTKDIFETQKKSILKDVNYLNIKELFYNNEALYPNHLKSYAYLSFRELSFYSDELESILYENSPFKIIEIFTKKGVGISTHLFLFFQRKRSIFGPKEGFIPFLIFNYPKLKAVKTISELNFLLNFAIVNCFLYYDEYVEYSKHVFELIKFHGLNYINDIIFDIIKDIRNINEKKNLNLPYVIIDRYIFSLDSDETFKKRLIFDAETLDSKIIFIYSLEEKKANEILYEYLAGNKTNKQMFFYTDTLYLNIGELPSKYPEIYSNMYPKINNYIKIQNCENVESAQKIMKSEQNEIIEHLSKFYETKEKKYYYINQYLYLINKEIDIKHIRQIFLNIPLEIFDFRKSKCQEGKIVFQLQSQTARNILEDISNITIFLMTQDSLLNRLNKPIQEFIIKKAIIQMMEKGETPFYKFENVYEIDSFLNSLRFKDYKCSSEKRKGLIKNLKFYKRLKDQYSKVKFDGKPTLIIPFNNKSKEWDLAFIFKNKLGKNELCLIQISVNIYIHKIQDMLTNFMNKIMFIKSKIREIYGIKIDFTNILFILSKQKQNPETIKFLKMYSIPFIFFNHYKGIIEFLNKDKSPLNEFRLLPEHHYESNKDKFENSLEYSSNELISDDEVENEVETNIPKDFEYDFNKIIKNKFYNDVIN